MPFSKRATTPPARVHVTGASGSGTTTLGRALAARLGYPLLDTDDFYWEPTDPPFERKRPIPERQRLLLRALDAADAWVSSGSLAGWGDVAVHRFDLVVFLWVPEALRLDRLRRREQARRLAGRAGPPEDFARRSAEFLAWAARYDHAGSEVRSRALHEAWLARLPCPVLRLEGDLPTALRAERVVARLRALPRRRGAPS